MAILDVLEPQLVRLRARYAKTPLPRFLSWWGRELVACLPQRWRDVLAEGREDLLLHTDGGEIVVRRETAHGVAALGTIALDQDAETQRAEFGRLRGSIDEPMLRQFYCISPARTLRRTLSLPAAAEDNLRQVLAFEMDRQTPFKADQVYFDYRVLGRDASGRQLHVDLVVMPRAQLDAELAPLAHLGTELDGVDCWQDAANGSRIGINLLPTERRARRRNVRLRMNLALVAIALVLAAGVMARTVTNREHALAAMTSEVETSQQEAKQVAALRKTLEETIDSANFLAQRKRTAIPMVLLLQDLTERLPDGTYLERLNVNEDGRIELQGLSDKAESLIAELQKSKVVSNPSFQGVIQPDPRIKKDRFNLIAQLKANEPAKPAEAPAAEGANQENKHASAAGSK